MKKLLLIISSIVGLYSLSFAYSPKTILSQKYDTNQFYLGATINQNQLGGKGEELLKQNFTYTTPENCAKQSQVYKEPGAPWQWEKFDECVAFAKKNNILIRAHGPISPQCSDWVKNDKRKPKELLAMLNEFFTTACKRYNDEPTVKWIDVVNETITREGDWFMDKPGIYEWENPWFRIGLNEDGIPRYIVRAFEIANEHASNKKLIYNQHGGMEPEMWEEVKNTILYLREKGLRVDGIGWQGHLKRDNDPSQNRMDLEYLNELIQWAHENDLEFHVTELDYWVRLENEQKSETHQKYQAKGFSNILKVLLANRKTGVVGLNFWNVKDKTILGKQRTSNIFDVNGKRKLAYKEIVNALNNPPEKFPSR